MYRHNNDIVAYFILYFANDKWSVTPPLETRDDVRFHYNIIKNVMKADFIKTLKITE